MMFEQKLTQMEKMKEQDLFLIVEGRNDTKVLSFLGFKKIIEISGKPLNTISDLIGSDESKSVVVLTDFDKEGELKASQLTKLLEKEGFKINHFMRKKFKTLFRIHKIEELINFTKFMGDDYDGKACSIYDKIFSRSRIHGRRSGGKTRRHRGDIWPDRGAAWAGP